MTPDRDKSNTVAHSPGGTFRIAKLQPYALCISGLVVIHMDGRLEFAPGVTLDEAAEQFWKRISEAFPGLFLPRDALHSAAPDLLEALKELLTAEKLDDDDPRLIAAREVARAAIQRAGGEE